MKNIYVLFGMFLLATACSPKVAKTTTTNYQEDISTNREDFVQLKAQQEAKQAEQQKENQLTKEQDFSESSAITTGVDAQLQAFAAANAGSYATKYTIQVYSGTSRDRANEIKSEVYELLPEAKPKVTYVQPTYRVRIGEYYSRVDAYGLYKKAKSNFGRAIIIPFKVKLGDQSPAETTQD